MSCELCERPAGTAYLCPSCAQDLADRLERLPYLLDRLADMLAPVRATDGGRRAAAVEARLPLDLEVVEERFAFAPVVGWHRAILDAPGWPAARPHDGIDAQVTAACIALRASVPWISAVWPAAGDLAREVRIVHDDARSVVGVQDLPVRMGRCPQTVDGAPCGAELLLPTGAQVLRCRWCGATYPPGVWAALKVAQARAFSPAGASA